eukprot:Protomagalhaensia_sp_Gyna_25__6076@NODE_971_length_2341_cov_31_681581_g771_i0_p1_GENE_NODE_971_length_2341_cov_31_681581_g771_i0NODE_971_length_2341_cov_31_681581_g771_i0_p1_ORF_typecomplete_len448_score41_69Dcc1/PF09724_9/0_046_NODE_971_length_2341_cov_31_681581_g771_i08422185
MSIQIWESWLSSSFPCWNSTSRKCLKTVVERPFKNSRSSRLCMFWAVPVRLWMPLPTPSLRLHEAAPHGNPAVDNVEYAFSSLLPPRSELTPRADSRDSCHPIDKDSDASKENQTITETAINLTAQWVRDPFVACQLLRFFVTSVRNGFDCIIPNTQNSPARDQAEFMDDISRLETTCKDMSITQRTGYRMGTNELKVYYLCALAKKGSKAITPQMLIRLTHGGGVQDKLYPGALYPFQSNVNLRIAKFANSFSECKDTFRMMFQSSRSPDLAGAITNARLVITEGSLPEKWYLWNWNIGMFGEITKSIITGRLTIEQAQELLGTTPDIEVALFLTILGGRAFTIDLPDSVFAALPPTENLPLMEDKHSTYLVFCDARSLVWNWEQRLKDMYRLKNIWPFYELKEYIGPLVEHDPNLDLDSIIAAYLEPHPELPTMYLSGNLHLERP